MNNNALSEKLYWDKILSNAKLPICIDVQNYGYSITMNFVHEFLNGKNYKTFLEVGCGSSGWLPYFAEKYNFVVSGVDYSEIGCRICEENLRMQNIDYRNIFCKDLFDPYCTNGEKYDVIFSYGVIEHFEDPEKVIKCLASLLNTSGIIISLVPNINGFIGFLSKIFINDIFKMHKIIDKKELRLCHTNNQLIDIKTNYAGIFTLGVIPLSSSNTWFFKEGSIQRKLTLHLISLIDNSLGYVFKIIPPRMGSSKVFSPYVISIAKNSA